jgi:hypothetical protein
MFFIDDSSFCKGKDFLKFYESSPSMVAFGMRDLFRPVFPSYINAPGPGELPNPLSARKGNVKSS